MNEDFKSNVLLAAALRLQSECYMLLFEHRQAMQSLKLSLELAWKTNNTEDEIKVYDRLAMCWFYLGDLDKSKYYRYRQMQGVVEPADSQARQVYEAVRFCYEVSRK